MPLKYAEFGVHAVIMMRGVQRPVAIIEVEVLHSFREYLVGNSTGTNGVLKLQVRLCNPKTGSIGFRVC